jgi:hypothetical protein
MPMYSQLRWLILLLGLLLQSKIISAQSDKEMPTCSNGCCCNNDPTPAGTMISHIHQKNEWMISYKYINTNMNGMFSGTTKMTNNDVYVNYLMASDKMHMDMHMLMGMYGVTDKLTVMAMFNYNVVSMNMSMLPSVMMNMPGMNSGNVNMPTSMKTSGISDFKLHILYGLINREQHRVLVSAGVSIPTGSIKLKTADEEAIYPNQHLPYSMQLGSGTVDVLPGITYLYQANKLTVSSQLTSVIRTGYNGLGYKLGNEATSNSWLSYQWYRCLSTSFRVEATVADKIDGYDPSVYYYNDPSSNPTNYGGEKINCYVGTVFQFKKGVLKNNRLGLEYGIPVYQNLNGIQMKLTQSVNASWALAF